MQAEEKSIGRRERKRQETRASLMRSAIVLFAERGFDAVTVNDIADRSDVDPSTFFRHFPTKESVLFTDLDTYVERIRPLMEARPNDEPIIETLRAITVALSTSEAFDLDLENLRAVLTESSDDLRQQVVAHRESVALELSMLLGERLGFDPDTDARPYLAATVWLAAFDWYRRRLVSGHSLVTNPARPVDELVDIVLSCGEFLRSSPARFGPPADGAESSPI